jgi:hypothetical protein
MIEENADYALLLEGLLVYSRAKTVVEIGVAFGYTTALLCRGARNVGGHVYGFDIWEAHGQSGQFDRLASKEEVQQRLAASYDNFTLTKANSQSPEFPALLKQICPQINLAFIDGDHSYTGIRNDFNAVYPLLANAGIIAFHDTLRIDGCREFMLDLRTRYNDGTFDLIDLPWGVWPSGIHDGLSILVKRDFQNRKEILEVCSSPSTPQEIYQREREWYRRQVRDPGSVAAQSSIVLSTGLLRQLRMLNWRLGRKWSGLRRRLSRKLGGGQQAAH